MARLAGSPVPVPTTFSSTSGAVARKPGPSRVLCTSTTFTSAPMATLSRVAADAGTTRARMRARMRTKTRGSMVNAPSGSRRWKPTGALRRDGDRDGSGRGGHRAVHHQDGVPHPDVVAIVGAEEEALLERAGQHGARGRRRQGEIRRAENDHGPPAHGTRVREALT